MYGCDCRAVQGPAYVSGQAVSILHPRSRCIFKNLFSKVCSYIPKLQKIYKKNSLQIYSSESIVPNLHEEIAQKAAVTFYAKEAVTFFSGKRKCSKMT